MDQPTGRDGGRRSVIGTNRCLIQVDKFRIDEKRSLKLDFLSKYLQEHGEGIEANAVFADCCGSAQGRFTAALRDSLECDVVYIGATRAVDWHECTTFGSILYGSLLRRKGAGFDASDWVWNAAYQSIEAYRRAVGSVNRRGRLVDGKCPFKVAQLDPSQKAKKAFANATRGRGLA